MSDTFRRRRTIINGVELDELFSGSSVINNVAISKDGNHYAHVSKEGNTITGEMPDDGILRIGDQVIKYKRGSGQGYNVARGNVIIGASGSVKISGSNSVVVSGSGSVIVAGGGLEFEIDRSYGSIDKVCLINRSHDVRLGLSSDDIVYINGLTGEEPENKAGRLFIRGLEGTISVPESNSDVKLDIKSSSGDIKGDVAHGGNIRTSSGDISVDIYAPLTVEVSTSSGDIEVRKMISEGRGIFTPPNCDSPVGVLSLVTSSGDVDVRYKLP